MYRLYCIRFVGATGVNVEVVLPANVDIMAGKSAEELKEFLTAVALNRLSVFPDMHGGLVRAIEFGEIIVSYFAMDALPATPAAAAVTGEWTVVPADAQIVNISALPGGTS